jgi:Fic family protein
MNAGVHCRRNEVQSTRQGSYVETAVGGERVRAFLPPPLPPNPRIDIQELLPLLVEAERAVARLDGISSVLPGTGLFLYMYVRKEALLSSQIEGTQSSLSDLLFFEMDAAPGVPLDDVQEVSNYVKAMTHGLKRLRDDDFPLSVRLLREIHGILLSRGRGADQDAGEFRRSQNWIGGTRPGNAEFVPPPPDHVGSCMSDLERFLHETSSGLPTLIKAGLAHVQFETIHPFLDGNGRLGRLLITLLLCAEGVLRAPLLYLSLYFKTHRQTYYALLQRVREEGAWEEWLEFYLEGVRDTAAQAARTAQRILELFAADRTKIETLGRAASSAVRVHDRIKEDPLLSIPAASSRLKLAQPTVSRAVSQLSRLGVLKEVTGRSRGRVFAYKAYLAILDEGTEPLPR